MILLAIVFELWIEKQVFNPAIPGVHKIVKHTLKILQQTQQDFGSVFDQHLDTRRYRIKLVDTMIA